jgi:hypothetical protein
MSTRFDLRIVRSNSMAYQSVNPFNGEVLRIFDHHTDQDGLHQLSLGQHGGSANKKLICAANGFFLVA